MRKSHRKHNYLADMPGSRWKDIGGQRFGKLVAWEPTGEKRHGQQVWLCKCDCGNVKSVSIGCLREDGGGTRSCGCLFRESHHRLRHGMGNTQIHGRWMSMLRRCSDPKATSYPKYGAKGIRVCERWHTFENFYADMGEPPFPKAQIDRIDPAGDYCPENCQWLSASDNARKTARQSKERLQKASPPCSRYTTLP